MRTIILIMLAMSGLSAFSQTKAKDVFAAAPDSIFPLLTTNNRLDCIDLIENNMKATVKNKLEQKAEMSVLTDSYLQIKPSEKSTAEIKVLDDSTFCLISTCMGPAPTAVSHSTPTNGNRPQSASPFLPSWLSGHPYPTAFRATPALHNARSKTSR